MSACSARWESLAIRSARPDSSSAHAALATPRLEPRPGSWRPPGPVLRRCGPNRSPEAGSEPPGTAPDARAPAAARAVEALDQEIERPPPECRARARPGGTRSPSSAKKLGRVRVEGHRRAELGRERDAQARLLRLEGSRSSAAGVAGIGERRRIAAREMRRAGHVGDPGVRQGLRQPHGIRQAARDRRRARAADDSACRSSPAPIADRRRERGVDRLVLVEPAIEVAVVDDRRDRPRSLCPGAGVAKPRARPRPGPAPVGSKPTTPPMPSASARPPRRTGQHRAAGRKPLADRVRRTARLFPGRRDDPGIAPERGTPRPRRPRGARRNRCRPPPPGRGGGRRRRSAARFRPPAGAARPRSGQSTPFVSVRAPR